MVLSGEQQLPRGLLALGQALLRRLNAVVQTVAHQMHERVHNPLDQALVEFGLFAEGVQPDLLTEFGTDITDHPRKAAEHIIHRHHPDGHDGFLQITGVAFQLAQASQNTFIDHGVEHRGGFRQHGLGDHQLTDQIDELVHLFHIHTNRTAVFGARHRARRGWRLDGRDGQDRRAGRLGRLVRCPGAIRTRRFSGDVDL